MQSPTPPTESYPNDPEVIAAAHILLQLHKEDTILAKTVPSNVSHLQLNKMPKTPRRKPTKLKPYPTPLTPSNFGGKIANGLSHPKKYGRWSKRYQNPSDSNSGYDSDATIVLSERSSLSGQLEDSTTRFRRHGPNTPSINSEPTSTRPLERQPSTTPTDFGSKASIRWDAVFGHSSTSTQSSVESGIHPRVNKRASLRQITARQNVSASQDSTAKAVRMTLEEWEDEEDVLRVETGKESESEYGDED